MTVQKKAVILAAGVAVLIAAYFGIAMNADQLVEIACKVVTCAE